MLKGPYAPLLGVFESADADILFLEFSTSRAGEIGSLLDSPLRDKNCILGLGVINPRTDEIESPQNIIAQVQKALEFVPPQRIWLNPDCGFATFANRPVARYETIEQKLRALNAAKIALRDRYE